MYYGNVTFVMSLPRSRTAWMAQTFYPGLYTMHDPLKACESIAELQQFVDSHLHEALEYHREHPVAVIDTSAVFFYPEINLRFPRARYLFVRRRMEDVQHSLAKAGQPTEMIREANKHYTAARTLANVDKHATMVVQYEDLNDVRVLHNMWRFMGALGDPGEGYFERMLGQNIQIPFEQQQRETDRHKVSRLFATRRSWI
jgi:hypothetical protein